MSKHRWDRSCDAIVAKYPMLTRHGLALIALERGLAAIETDPKWFEKVGKSK